MQLKRRLYDEYGGFADKRIKKLEKGSQFIVDDRTDSDIGADKKLLSYFCSMYLVVEGDNAATLRLHNNVPMGPSVEKWGKKNGVELNERVLTVKITPKNYGILKSLAEAIEAITAPGAPRYSVPSYKYVCPRTAASLRRLHSALDQAWSGGKGLGFGL